MWVLLSRGTWEQYSFSRLKKADVAEMIVLGREWKSRKITDRQAMEAFDTILSR